MRGSVIQAMLWLGLQRGALGLGLHQRTGRGVLKPVAVHFHESQRGLCTNNHVLGMV